MAREPDAQPVAPQKPDGLRSRMIDGSILLHPFLFAIASVLALLVQNLTQATLAHAVPALAGSLAFAFAAYLAVAAVRRRLDACSAVIASVWIA